MTARLEHPGTPAVYDTGVETALDGTSRVWLVMQLLRGSTVEALLDRADFSASAACDGTAVSWAAAIAAQIAAVLADVHRVDIVHRDIKPSNVMVTEGGLVKVLDFGIAILQGASALPRLTQVDRTIGTPPYMSPEQCLGQPVAAASDMYSLGCLLCELLTGDQPFFESESMPLRAHHLQTPAAISAGTTGRRADGDRRACTSMLAKDAAARPSAEAVYAALLPFALLHRRTGPRARPGTRRTRTGTRRGRSAGRCSPRRRGPPKRPPSEHTDRRRGEAGARERRGATPSRASGRGDQPA